ncbi:hypothetical protein C8034_v003285 [Colletotrichum sidae]|uniref:Pentatricopeptide repeat-containing protein n=1 Tax=Colletotrichum sidae TaxID=1347389 RepID=A0A4V3I4A4_9PEZI|nr:hypothetical protein C8034_v003285 [Colletotrichum sidae]
MFLGITLSWRARSHRLGVSRISLIPRSPRWSRAHPAHLSLACRQSIHTDFVATTRRPGEADYESGHAPAQGITPKPSHSVTANSSVAAEVSLPSAPRTGERQALNDADRASSRKPLTPQSSTAAKNTPRITSGRYGSSSPIDQPLSRLKLDSERKQDGKRATRDPIPQNQRNKAIQKYKDSVLVSPPITYDVARETRTSSQRYEEGVQRQSRLSIIRQIKGVRFTNWRDTLDLLRLRTRGVLTAWKPYARKIDASADLAEALLHTVDYTIWDIQDRSRCQIELHWAEKQKPSAKPPAARLLLSGDDHALEHAVEEITRLATRIGGRMRIDGAIGSRVSTPLAEELNFPDGQPMKTWHSTLHFERPANQVQYTLERRYEEIAKPRVWTPQTFEAYIAALTRSCLAPTLAHKLYGSGVAAANALLGLLHGAFDDPEARSSLSTRALKLALQFIESHGHSYRHHALQLVEDMQRLGLRLDTDVFNIAMGSNVKVKDLDGFDVMLKRMLRYGCLPNLDTWILFLQMMENERVRRHVIKIMHSLGFFSEPRAVPLIANQLAHFDVREYGATDKELASVDVRGQDWSDGIRPFMESMDAKYGSSWKTLANFNKIMNELGRMGKYECCLELFDAISESTARKPTTLTINTMLLHGRSGRKLDFVIAALERAHKHRIPLDEQSYHEVFQLAFRLRKANMMGLVWRFASIKRMTSWHMRNRVSHNTYIDRPPADAKTDNGHDWPALPRFHQPNMVAELQRLPVKKRGPAIANMLWARYASWVPVDPLHAMLARAWEADNAVHAAVKQAKQERTALLSQNLDGPAPLRKITVPGVPLVLRRPTMLGLNGGFPRGLGESLELEQSITHLAPSSRTD